MLRDPEVLDIISSGVLLGRAAEALSPFEAETVAEIGQRFVTYRREAVVTEAEWQVLRTALEAMRRAMAERLAQGEAEAA
ncbi:MAG: hypothetical protein H2041_01410 [Phenylobacterium sp.]|uniref:hypothetical protein n=1 Tax=Phenylobacterium sp. TaxID=1871053 RepID=UPI0017A4E435|nr:hypothetical protein [Phenylobacterium sp.]MBA4792303.1 hypothetical protein [Phenylobacterium sp.]